MEYRAAFDKAKAVEDILPFMSAERRKQVESTPAAERREMFDMIKTLGALTNVKVTKETRTANGATLMVDALDGDKSKTTGTITLVQENGAWKIDKESFKSSSNQRWSACLPERRMPRMRPPPARSRSTARPSR
jgi:hypothetical protein